MKSFFKALIRIGQIVGAVAVKNPNSAKTLGRINEVIEPFLGDDPHDCTSSAPAPTVPTGDGGPSRVSVVVKDPDAVPFENKNKK